MKELSVLLFLIMITIWNPAKAFISQDLIDQFKVIYGTDNRVEVSDYPDRLFQDHAKSVGAMIHKDLLKDNKDGTYKIEGKNLSKALNICSDEKFADQLAVANCNGFLVSSNILVTAGHCTQTHHFCKNQKWVFDYTQENTMIDSKAVYGCKNILEVKINEFHEVDYAVIELDRHSEVREPLKYRKRGYPKIGDELVLIGTPSGIPLKIADNAFVRKTDNPYYFVASTDSFHGNSGSPVFNKESGIVEGLLVRGDKDYILDYKKSCFRPKKCSQEECRGEDIIYLRSIRKLSSYIRTHSR